MLNEMLNCIYEFRECFQQHIARSWADCDSVATKLAARLIREETAEYNAAGLDKLEDLLDALGDVTYVVLGAIAACGVKPENISGEVRPYIFDAVKVRTKIGIADAMDFLAEVLEKNKCYRSHHEAINKAWTRLLLAACFLKVDLLALFKEIHRSNMTKLWSTAEIKSAPAGAEIRPAGAMYVVKLNGKVIKPPSFSPPNCLLSCLPCPAE